MGMRIEFVAAKTSVSKFREAFSQAWPEFETVAVDESFPDANSMWAWKESNEKFVSAAEWTMDNPGREVFMFWQDGPWAVMMDASLASDEEGLQRLSVRLGTVVSLVVAGSWAEFWCYEKGILRRNISSLDEVDVLTQGEPLPEEAGIDTCNFSMDESEALWKSFGLSPFEKMPTSVGCQAICVIDRTDYSDLDPKWWMPAQPEATKATKPWWKFW